MRAGLGGGDDLCVISQLSDGQKDSAAVLTIPHLMSFLEKSVQPENAIKSQT